MKWWVWVVLGIAIVASIGAFVAGYWLGLVGLAVIALVVWLFYDGLKGMG